MIEETGSQLQPEVIPLPSTPISPSSSLQTPAPPSPSKPTYASNSASEFVTRSSSLKAKHIPQPLKLSSSLASPPMGSPLAVVATVASFAHQSELPSIAARRANNGSMKSGRELLLPIGVNSGVGGSGSNSNSRARSGSNSGLSSYDIGTPSPTATSPTRLRNSLEKAVASRKDGPGGTPSPTSPGSASASASAMRLSPRQSRFTQNVAENDYSGNVVHITDGSYPPHSPRSIRSRHSAQSLALPSPSHFAGTVATAARNGAGAGTYPASPSRSEHFPPSPQSPGTRHVMKQPSTASLTPSAVMATMATTLATTKARQTPSTKHPFSPRPPLDVRPFVPIISEKTGKSKRNYEDYPSRNRFFLNGRILSGGDTPVYFMMSITLLLGLAGTWFGTTAVWWWHNESPAVAIVGAYMCLLTISSMMATALRDPGIMPRDLDPNPPYSASSPDVSSKIPLPREVRIRDGIVRMKYCVTCRTYRSPRASHCKTCDNCVDGCDHHCQWVNNCVGRRNYTSFITFVVVACLTLALVIVTSAIHLLEVTRKDHTSFGHALHLAAGSAVVFSISIVVIWPLLSLLGYHIRLLIFNITTIEQLRNNYEKQISEEVTGSAYNPYSYGKWYRNMAYLLCRPAGFTWIEASSLKMDDRREINPGAYEDWEMVDCGDRDHDETAKA